MMLLFFALLGIAAIAIMAVIVLRHLPQLANLDVDNLPSERESRKKKEILNKRIENQSEIWKATWGKKFVPLVKFWGIFQLKFRIYVGKIERLWHHEERLKLKEKIKELSAEEKAQRIDELVKQGDLENSVKNFENAEEIFINAIKLDPKSQSAYLGLAEAYFGRGLLKEASETYRFVLQLNPENDTAMVKFADLLEQEGNIEEAIGLYQQAAVINDSLSSRFYHLAELLVKVGEPQVAKEAILQAVELEPKNPKYLDLLIEIAILVSDKVLAGSFYSELRLVNPDNNKLVEFKQRIESI